jgi:hypothetical protein
MKYRVLMSLVKADLHYIGLSSSCRDLLSDDHLCIESKLNVNTQLNLIWWQLKSKEQRLKGSNLLRLKRLLRNFLRQKWRMPMGNLLDLGSRKWFQRLDL